VYRRWSVLLLAPAAAILAAGLAAEPLLVHWRQTFLRSAAGFFGAIFPTVSARRVVRQGDGDSGAVSAIAGFMMRAAIMVVGITQRRGEFSIHRTDSEFRVHFRTR
jgi:hypothetical protein